MFARLLPPPLGRTIPADNLHRNNRLARMVPALPALLVLMLFASPLLCGAATTAVSGLTCASAAETGVAQDACFVTLTQAAPSRGLRVTLSSSSRAVRVPGSIRVPAGATSASFAASISWPKQATAMATLSASGGGVTKGFTLQLLPAGGTPETGPSSPGTEALASLSCAGSSFSSAGSDLCTVTISVTAPGTTVTPGTAGSNFTRTTLPAVVTVNLASSSSDVQVPAWIAVTPTMNPAAVFPATVSQVKSAETVTLTASALGGTQTFTLQLSPPTPELTLGSSSVAFGSVDLNTPVTQTVTMTSSGTAAATVSAASVSGAGFSVSGASFPITLNPGQSANLNLQFNPKVAGASTGAVSLTSNCSMGAMAIALSGTGKAATYTVELSWEAPGNSTDPAVGYNIYRATGTGAFQRLNAAVDLSVSYSDTTAKSGTTYKYEVTSVDASGVESTASNTWTAAIP